MSEDKRPRIYARAGDVEVTVQGSDEETSEDIEDTFSEKFDDVCQRRQELADEEPTEGFE